MNLYAYVGNDPLNATDPTGMFGDGIGAWVRNSGIFPAYTDAELQALTANDASSPEQIAWLAERAQLSSQMLPILGAGYVGSVSAGGARADSP